MVFPAWTWRLADLGTHRDPCHHRARRRNGYGCIRWQSGA